MGEFRTWFQRWFLDDALKPEQSTCPVCGLPIEISSARNFCGIGGAWTLPVSRSELVPYCNDQNGTTHGRGE